MEKAELSEISMVVFIVKRELGRVVTEAEIPADSLGGLWGKEKAAEGCGPELGSCCLCASNEIICQSDIFLQFPSAVPNRKCTVLERSKEKTLILLK